MSKHVTLLRCLVIDKPAGGRIIYSPGLQLVDEELAEQWQKAGFAEPYPKPTEEPVASSLDQPFDSQE